MGVENSNGKTLKTINDFQYFYMHRPVVVDYGMLYHIADHYISNKDKKEKQTYYLNELINPLNFWFDIYNINSAIRVAHFLAQACCETANFFAMTEQSSGAAYENSKPLGNTLPGDGAKFIGRGLLHLTGRENYTKTGKRLGLDLVNNPDIVASDLNIAVKTACDFWKINNINKYADKDDFSKITQKVNGGKNAYDARYNALVRIKNYLGINYNTKIELN